MAAEKKLHIVMFPWLAFGHMIPYLQLSKLIAQKGHRVSFVSTTRNIDRLPTDLHPDLAPFLSFIKLPLPLLQNLPQNAEATIDLPYDQVQYLKKAYDLLKQPLTEFLRSSGADWIVYDFAPYWLGQEVGPSLGIRTAFFSIFIPQSLAFIGPPSEDRRKSPDDFTIPPEWIPFPTTVAFRYFEIKKIFDSVTGNITGVTDLERFKMSIRYSDVVVVRGCPQFQKEWFPLIGDLYGKPVFPVGLLPTTEYDAGDHALSPAWRPIQEWLDERGRGSVVYVAFGSEAKPNQEELIEIAYGLELSGLPFLWALRTRHGPGDPEPIELPEGFEERSRGRGLVWRGWAPQLRILRHESVGGFLTHAGLSSVVEAVQCGRGLIFLNLSADQGIIARVMEEKKIGYCVPRNEMDGWFSRDSVAESVKLVMVKEEGKIYREGVKEMKDVFVNEEKEGKLIDQILEYMKSHTTSAQEQDVCLK